MLERDKMRAASQTFRLIFKRSLQNSNLPKHVQDAMLLAEEFSTTAFVSKMRWWTSAPIMRHWLGPRVHRELEAEGFDVTLKPFESTVDVKRDDIMFDLLAGYTKGIQQMAREVMLLTYRRILEVIMDGFAGATYLCFDGEPLFDDSHTFGDNKSNLVLDVAGTALDTAKVAMAGFTDPVTGDQLGIRPTHLWHHTALLPTVTKLLGRSELSGGGTNQHFGTLAPLELDLGSGKTGWWGIASLGAGEPMKPLAVFKHPRAPGLIAADAETDKLNFEERIIVYGTEAWRTESCGMPMYIWGSDGSA